MKAYSVTDVGKSRQVNQDYVLCEENAVGSLPNLFLVADGMGGHRGGGFASRYCAETIVAAVRESSQAAIVAVLREAVRQANTQIRQRAAEDPDLDGMGTTVVIATLAGNTLYVANVGDSRLYVHSGGKLRQITEDHSLVEAMIRNGDLDRRVARFHPNKNIITRALGGQPDVNVDFFEVALAEGDTVLLCSDGLTNMIDDEEIEEILEKQGNDLEAAAGLLVQRANDYGGRDNIAVVVIKP